MRLVGRDRSTLVVAKYGNAQPNGCTRNTELNSTELSRVVQFSWIQFSSVSLFPLSIEAATSFDNRRPTFLESQLRTCDGKTVATAVAGRHKKNITFLFQIIGLQFENISILEPEATTAYFRRQTLVTYFWSSDQNTDIVAVSIRTMTDPFRLI